MQGLRVGDFGFVGNDPTHDDRPAIQAAIDAIGRRGGGTLRFPSPAGTAWIHSFGHSPHALQVSYDDLTIDFNGWTLRDSFADSLGAAVVGNSPATGPIARTNYEDLPRYAFEDAPQGARTITLTTSAAAAHFRAGDALHLRQGLGTPSAEINEVLAVDGAVLRLRWPLSRPFVADGVSPFGVANAQADTRRGLTIRHLTLASHVVGFGLSQWIDVRLEHCTYRPLATLDPGPVPFSLGDLRQLVLDDVRCALPYAAGGGGLLQLGRDTVDVEITRCDWASGGVAGQVLLLSEHCAQIHVLGNRFSGRGQIAGSLFRDLDFHHNQVAIDTGTPAPAVVLQASGTDNPGQRLSNNTFESPNPSAGVVVTGGPDCAFTDNLVRAAGIGVDAVIFTGSGPGLLCRRNRVHTAWGGILLATTGHRALITENVVVQAGAPAGYAISVADLGAQPYGPRIVHNTIVGCLGGVVVANVDHEPGIDAAPNTILETTTAYVPATLGEVS